MLDLRCELCVAYKLLQERKFEVAYEQDGLRKGRAPDFTVTWKTHTVFNVEVKRFRGSVASR